MDIYFGDVEIKRSSAGLSLCACRKARDEEGNTEHGNDERIRLEEVRRGPRILFDVEAGVAGR
jgi:hypothetical protein